MLPFIDDFQLIFEQSPSPYALLAPTPDFTILSANQAYLALAGRTRAELVGKPLLQAFPADPREPANRDAAELLRSLERVLATQAPDTMPVQRYDVEASEGSGAFVERYWSAINTPVRSAQGEVRFILHHVEEVTDVVHLARQAPTGRAELAAFRSMDAQRRAHAQREQQAREQADEEHRKLRELFENAPLGIAIFRGPDHVIEFANPYELRIWGRQAEDVIGRTVAEALPEIAQQGLIEQVCDPVFRTGQPLELIELPIRFDINGDGHLVEGFFNFVHVPLRAPDGSVDGFIAVAWNVTDAVKARQEAQRLGRQLSERIAFEQQLTGIVSHDLRNPLNVIALSASVMARRGCLDPQDSQLLIRIQNAAHRAARLVGDLLDFTQARLAGSLPVRPEAMDLHELTRGVLLELEVEHPQRTLALQARGDARGHWDPQRMSQVVQNLVANALAYSPAQTEVRIGIEEDAQAGGVRLWVHNLGSPISDDLIERLFEPLRRGTDAASGENGGRSVGLGLYIVKHIVEAHGGRVDVVSTADAGTTFTVRLPRRSPGLAPAAV